MTLVRVEDRVCEEIISTVAEREDVDEREITKPLYDVINPEALATLFQDGSGRVTFDYLGYRVTVNHEYSVEVASVENR